MLFGYVNAAGSLALGNLFRGELGEVGPGILLGLVFGIFFATPFGFLCGASPRSRPTTCGVSSTAPA